MKLEVAIPIIIVALVLGRILAGVIAARINPKVTIIKIRKGEIRISGKELSEPFETIARELETIAIPGVDMAMESSFNKEGGLKVKVHYMNQQHPDPAFDITEYMSRVQKILLKYKPAEYDGIIDPGPER
jgi:hypothetical protein